MTYNVIQSAGGTNYGTSASATFTTANVADGNKIIVVVSSTWTTAPTSVRDAALNNWTILGSKVSASGSTWLYALDVPAGDVGTKPTITATISGTNGQSIVIQEVSGLLPGNTSAMIDGSPGTLTGNTAATGSPTYSSTAANEYLVCTYGTNTQDTVAAIAGWSLDANSQNAADNSDSCASIEYKASTNGTETGGFTSSLGTWSLIMVAFELAPTGPSIDTADPMPDATQGVAYSEDLAASGGTAPYLWTLDSGSLPDGLVLS